MGVGGECHAPATLPPRYRPRNHRTGGWVSPTAGLDGRGKEKIGIRTQNRPAHSKSLFICKASITSCDTFSQKLVRMSCNRGYNTSCVLTSIPLSGGSLHHILLGASENDILMQGVLIVHQRKLNKKSDRVVDWEECGRRCLEPI